MTRKIVLDYWQKPIPMRTADWTAIFDDYDGAPDAHSPIGYGETKEEAIADLLDTAELYRKE